MSGPVFGFTAIWSRFDVIIFRFKKKNGTIEQVARKRRQKRKDRKFTNIHLTCLANKL